jgi:hypothetical protein
MKKQLLNLFILLCLMSTVSVFGQKAQSSITSTSSNLNYTPKSKGKGTQAVTSTTTSSCMSINLPAPATWSLVNYGTGTPIFADGFVNGPNTYGDKEKAMYFDASASANTMITQVYVGFDHAYSATPTKTVAIRIYDGTSLSPGTALGSGTLNMSTIMTDVANNQYSLLIFPTPINLPASKRFFVSVDVTGLQWTSTIHDSLSIVSNSDPQTVPTQVWEKWSTNAWVKYDNASSWQLDISLLIHPFLRQTPMTASISTTPGNTICAGKTINYNSAGSTTGGTFEWYFGSIPTPSATGATTMATYPAAGTFTTILLVEDACGSLKLTSNTITVLPNPTVTATPNSTTVCNGTNITLNGGGASTYAWTGGVTNNVAFTPSVTANYTVTGTAVNGCTAIAISAVVVNPNPVITVNSGSICSGQSFTMTPSGANTYTFSSGPVVSPTSNTSYSVTGTSAAGCISTSPAVSNVTVNANPTAILSSNSPVCANTAINLFANSVPGASYQWAGPNSYSSITQNPTIATASAIHAGIYSATVTSVAGCKGTSSVAVNVNPAPTASATSGGSITCVLTTQTLNGSGVSTYTWSGPGIVSGGNTANPTVNTPGTYTLIGSSSAGCVSAPVMIGVFSNTVAPTESITVSSGSVCPGNTSNLSVSGAYSYSWSTGSSSTSIVVSPTVGTTYSVLVTDLSNGCSITLNQAIGVYALPAVSASSASSLICGPPFQQTVTITASGASTYTWNTTAISNSISVSPSVTTQYTVTGTDANGCSNMTTFTQSVSACTGLEALGVQSSEIVVYPNPSNGNFTVKGLSNGMSVEIYNSIGQLIVKHETVSEIINVDGLSKGIYFVNVVENGKRIATKKVICE